jgi:5-methylcytosine-specific restriction protein A
VPFKAKRPCRAGGCPNLVTPGTGQGTGYCDVHAYKAVARKQYKAAHVRTYDDKRGSSAERGYGAAWQRTRDLILQMHPTCDVCSEQATEVHHRVPIDQGGALHDWSNLVPLCHRCHMRIERAVGRL